MKHLYKCVSFISLIFITTSCNDVIEFSPYDADVEYEDLNKNFTRKLTSKETQIGKTITFAFLSDTHVGYDEFSDAVNSINKQPDISFVAVCGDITDYGLAKEYQYYGDRIKKLHFPVVTINGNHDYLSNGQVLFKNMFGEPNFTFQYGSYKFIAFDDVVLEKGNVSPDFPWLKNEVENSDKKCIILTHIPPWTDQFTEDYKNTFYNIAAHSNVLVTFHGHLHNQIDTVIQNKRYFVTKAVFKRRYNLVHLTGDEVNVETIDF